MNEIINMTYFIELGLKHINSTQNPDEIKLYDYQHKLLRRLMSEDRMIILKARQIGITILFLLYALYKAHNNRGYVTYFVFLNNSQISYFRKILIEALNKMGITDNFGDNRNKIAFDNGSLVYLVDQMHGDVGVANFVYVDEYASYLSDFKYDKYETIEKLVIASTAERSDTKFHKLWKENKNGLGAFYPVRLPYNVHPDRNADWLEKHQSFLVKKTIKSELKCKFIKDKAK